MSLVQHLAPPISCLRPPLLEDYPLLDLRVVSQRGTAVFYSRIVPHRTLVNNVSEAILGILTGYYETTRIS